MAQDVKKKIAKRLTKKESACALQKGLGRAYIHVSKYGLKNVADLVLDACLHNQNYDTQCESSRENWLFEMIKEREEYPYFRSSILIALETETNRADLFQLCGLAKEMAQNGDKEAKRVLRKCVLNFAKIPELEGLGAEDFIEVYGNSAVLDLAKIYGKRLLKNPDEEIYGFHCDEDRRKPLIENSGNNHEIKALLDYLVKSNYFEFLNYKELTNKQKRINRQKHRREYRKEYPLKKIIEDARNGIGEYPENYVRFGEYATARELEKICNLILTEADEEVRMRLLWIFRRAILPKYSRKYFNWANGEHKGLRHASIAALAQVSDERVHKLARQKAKVNQIVDADSEALDLFIENYISRDAKLIINALNSVRPSPDDAHDLSLSIRHLTDYYKDPKLTDALIWVYENTPCTMCREEVVKKLYEFGNLKDTILHECLYDANEDIREFARKLNNQAEN